MCTILYAVDMSFCTGFRRTSVHVTARAGLICSTRSRAVTRATSSRKRSLFYSAASYFQSSSSSSSSSTMIRLYSTDACSRDSIDIVASPGFGARGTKFDLDLDLDLDSTRIQVGHTRSGSRKKKNWGLAPHDLGGNNEHCPLQH